MYKYLDFLKQTLDELELHDKPKRIWNLDESSLSIGPRKMKEGAINNQWFAPPEQELEGTVYAASKKGWMEGDK